MNDEIIGFYLADVMSLLWRRKLLIAISCLLGLGLGVAAIVLLPPTYVAEGQVVVRAEASVSPDTERAYYSTAINEAVVTTERQVMTAEGLLTRVMDSVNIPPRYTEPGVLRTKFNELSDRLKWRERLGLPPAPPDPADAARQLAIRRYAAISNAVSTGVDKGSSVITVKAATSDPRFSADIVRRILTLYMEDRLKSQQVAAHNVEVALRDRLDQTKSEIARVEEKVSSLMRQPGAGDLAEAARERNAAGGVQAVLASRILELEREKESLSNLRRIAGTIEDRLIAVAAQPVDANARILTWPLIPLRPAFPDKAMFCVIGLLLGMVLSSASIILREYLQRSKPTVTSQASLLPGRLLGSLPLLRRGRSAATALSMNFQGIAFQVEDACARDGFQVVTITSCVPNEGKTTVAVNLALALSKSGKRVLLINGDLYRGAKWTSKRRRQTGSGGRFHDITSTTLISPRANLDVLPVCARGLNDPIAFLRSAEFLSLIEAARREYDLILCDTPPVFSVPDALLVARASDAVLVVAEHRNGMNKAMTAEISRRIAGTGRPICGVVLTKTPSSDIGYASYAGYYPTRSSRTIMGALELAMDKRMVKADLEAAMASANRERG
jgi:capsular exopolysaccharide synthesis family protein